MDQLGLMGNDILGNVWEKLADGLVAFGEGRANLPLDSYLRTSSEDQFDRIIAKSGVVEDIAGVKWIASGEQIGPNSPRTCVRSVFIRSFP